MHTIARNPLLSSLLLVLIALSTLFFRLGSLPFIGSDEPRYARIAQEMQEAGHWVTPHLEHRPWLEKPPLYYWITIPFYKLFGVSEFTARMGSAFSALIASFAIFWLGTRLWSPLAGLLGAGILLTATGMISFGRGASTDMPVTACLTVALALFAAAAVEDGFAAWKVGLAWVFLGLGVLAKGPVALILAGGIGLGFWLLDEKGSAMRRWHPVAGILIAAAVSLPWFWLAFKENGFAFIATFFVNHNLARFITDIHHHTEPFYYYLPILPGLLFPWTGWLLLLVPRPIRDSMQGWREWNRAVVFIACWVLFPFLFFSASRSKLPGYILPSIPPLALLLGWRMAQWSEEVQKPPRAFAAASFHLLVSVALAIAYPLVMLKRYDLGWAGTLPVSAVVVIPAVLAFVFAIKGNGVRVVEITLVHGLILVLVLTQLAFPAVGNLNSTKRIAGQIAAVREAGEPLITYHFFHHTLHYYTGYTVYDDINSLESFEAFTREHRRFLIVAPAEALPDLQNLTEYSSTLLGEQGRLRLLRLARR